MIFSRWGSSVASAAAAFWGISILQLRVVGMLWLLTAFGSCCVVVVPVAVEVSAEHYYNDQKRLSGS